MKKVTAVREKELAKVINLGDMSHLVEITCVEAEDGTPTTKIDTITIANDLTETETRLANKLLNAIGDEIGSEMTEGCCEEDVDVITCEEMDEIYFINGEIIYFEVNVKFV